MAPTAPTHDLYSVLEIQPSATYEEIKRSYRRLVRLHHPDKNAGSPTATAKVQLINSAWEVLGDSCKRREYDILYGSRARTSTRSRPTGNRPAETRPSASESTHTSPPNEQPRRPENTFERDARAEAESQRKRQQWLKWEMRQEESIRQCKKQVTALTAQIADLGERIKNNRKILEDDVPHWFNLFPLLFGRLPEKKKNDLRHEILDSDAAIRIKQASLDREQPRLQQLNDELVRRRAEETQRLSADQAEKERRETRRREYAEAESRRQSAEAHAREKERAAREKAAREKAAREKERAAREKAAREKAAQEKKAAEERAARARASKTESGRSHKSAKQQRSTMEGEACIHKYWWNKTPGPLDCEYCDRPLFRFAYRCPGCSAIACAACMQDLKWGRKR